MPLWTGVFQFGIFLVLFWVNWWVFLPSVLLRVLLTLFYVAYLFGFFWLSYFAPKFFCFPCIRLLVCLRAISAYLLVEFFSLFWNVLFSLYYFILSLYLVNLHFFASSFWFISSGCVVIFTCVAFFLFVPCSCVFPLFYYFLLVINFLFAFPVKFPIQVLSFYSCFFGEPRFFTD